MRLNSKRSKPIGKAPRCVLNISKAVHQRFKAASDARGLKLMRAGDMALMHYVEAGMPSVAMPEAAENGGGK